MKRMEYIQIYECERIYICNIRPTIYEYKYKYKYIPPVLLFLFMNPFIFSHSSCQVRSPSLPIPSFSGQPAASNEINLNFYYFPIQPTNTYVDPYICMRKLVCII